MLPETQLNYIGGKMCTYVIIQWIQFCTHNIMAFYYNNYFKSCVYLTGHRLYFPGLFNRYYFIIIIIIIVMDTCNYYNY